MFSSFGVRTAAIAGLDVTPVTVEADISSGLPRFTIVGLPDAAVQEARERVRAAIHNSDLPFPRTRVTVNLAPGNLKKIGTGFDLPVALTILRVEKVIPNPSTKTMFVGELALDGRLVPVTGILPLLTGLDRHVSEVVIPEGNAAEATLQRRIRVLPAQTLRQVVDHLAGKQPLTFATAQTLTQTGAVSGSDLADVRGQHQAKRALEIAAAGGHNLLLTGPPGAGKTLLARALAGILPPLTHEELLEVVSIHSVAGFLPAASISLGRPFRAPHHTSSAVALVGGGHDPRPGEISLAHHGVLFLDELPEFPRTVLEALRQPLEEGAVQVSRAEGRTVFPARFLLVAARNPCPCGYAGSATRRCECASAQIVKYLKRISGPLLDRIDLHVTVRAVPVHDLRVASQSEPTASVRARVSAARQRQTARLGPVRTNSTLTVRELRQCCQLPAAAERLLEDAVRRLGLTARSYFRLRKISRTIADLAGAESIATEHLAEALQYRERVSSE